MTMKNKERLEKLEEGKDFVRRNKALAANSHCSDSSGSQYDSIDEIELEPVRGSSMCKYSIIENNQKRLYENQEKILFAIKMLSENTKD